MQWYALQVMAGRENSIRTRILDQLQRNGVSQYVAEIAVPSTVVVENKGNKRVEKEERLMPGYVMVCADWPMAGGALLAISGVRGFVGEGDNPVPMPEEEVSRLLGRQAKVVDPARAPVKMGDQVRIIGGPLSDFEGEVIDVDLRTQQATVMVQIFGRATPTQVAWGHLRLEG